MTEQKGKGYQGIRAIEAFEYKNTRSHVITKKNEKEYVRLQLSIKGAQGAFPNKVAPDIDDFTDEPEFQCDVQVVKILL